MFELTQTADGRNVLTLPSALDHGVLPHLKATLMAALEQDRPLDINASAVRKMTTLAAQLLIAARTGTADGDTARLRMVSPSPSFTEFVSTLALEQKLGLTEISR